MKERRQSGGSRVVRSVGDLLVALVGEGDARRVFRDLPDSPPARLTFLWRAVRRAAPALLGNMQVTPETAPVHPAYAYTRRNLPDTLRDVPLRRRERELLLNLRQALFRQTGLRSLIHETVHHTHTKRAWPLVELDQADPAASRALTGRGATRRVTLTRPESIDWYRSQEECALPVILLHEEFHIAIAARIGGFYDEPPLAVRVEELVAELVEYAVRLWLYQDAWPTLDALEGWLGDDEEARAILYLARHAGADEVSLRPLVALTVAALTAESDRAVARLLTAFSGERRSATAWHDFLA